MEERSEVLEMLVERWKRYYRDYQFYCNVSNDFNCVDRYISKYHCLCIELTHIIKDIMHKSFEETQQFLMAKNQIKK